MTRSVLGEALIIGLVNALTFFALTGMKMTIYTRLILTGAFVHLIFEYSPFGNVNKSWCHATFPTAKA